MVDVYDGGRGWSGKEWQEDAAVTGEALEGVVHVVLGTQTGVWWGSGAWKNVAVVRGLWWCGGFQWCR